MVPMIAIFDGLSANRLRARLKEAPRRGGETGPAEASCAQIPPCVRIHCPLWRADRSAKLKATA
jgi:hypothetical protein